ncbi:1-acyl-sn-glycerol-3-phosphate acyltransferase [Streptococcus gallolyticus]|nr:1-acyl-sn-glycerol-3-phosphate acyltransferase [Streptococcus gallolyticus]MBY5040490.1 1-acyl-sn-glycerol-3-phosphate acyltransferase [Streptococcus gallolyticus]
MFYSFLRNLLVFLLWAVNGNVHYHDKENILPEDENYILVAPHKNFWDPIFLGFGAAPKKFIFMAKKELFKNRGFGWWIRKCGAFPVDRENPSQAVLKYPVKMLKKSDRSLVMFPSGSRHTTELKGGVAVIAKTAKVKIMPANYVGPNALKGLLTGERVDVVFGHPIDVSDIKRMDEAGIAEVTSRIEAEFSRLDVLANSYQTKKKLNPLTYIYRIPVIVLVLLILLVTYIGSYVASFFINPDVKLED